MTEPNSSGNNEKRSPASNPFQAPNAYVDDVRQGSSGSLLDEPTSLSAGRGTAWIGDGWSLFREATGLWIGISVVFLIILMGLSMIPFVGQIANYFVGPLVGAGLMLGCQSLDRGEGLRFDHLFAGFQKNAGQLLLIGLIYLGCMIVFLVIAMAMVGTSIASVFISGQIPAGVTMSSILLVVLFMLLFSIPLSMSVWFAPALVALNDLSAIEAMKRSFRGCLGNILPFLIYGVVMFVLFIIAAIPMGLGLLFLMPTMICSTYIAYREIFLAQD